MSVNYIKLATPSSRYQMSAIERSLQEGAYSAEQLADQLKISRRRANEYLRRLKGENKIHIHKYEVVLSSHREYPVAFYIYGDGIDAIYQRKTQAQCSAAYRERVKQDPKKLAKAKKKKQAYWQKIKTDPKYRTVYENKLWKDRSRVVRCDIAASWIK